MGDYITEKILNLKDEILKWAAPKVHSHPEYESNNTIPNHADVSNKYGQGTDKLYGHVKVDSVLKEDSINPIQNRKVTEAINNKSDINHTHKLTDINNLSDALTDYIKGTYQNPIVLTDVNDNYIDTLIDPNVYSSKKIWFSDNTWRDPSSTGTASIPGLINVYSINGQLCQHIITNIGREWKRYAKVKFDNDGNVSSWVWGPWFLSFTINPINIEDKVIESYNNNVHNIQILENHHGYIIIWDQASSAHPKFYSGAYQSWKHVALFRKSSSLQMQGKFVVGDIMGKMDLRIDQTGIYVRYNGNPNTPISDISNFAYYVPKTISGY